MKTIFMSYIAGVVWAIVFLVATTPANAQTPPYAAVIDRVIQVWSSTTDSEERKMLRKLYFAALEDEAEEQSSILPQEIAPGIVVISVGLQNDDYVVHFLLRPDITGLTEDGENRVKSSVCGFPKLVFFMNEMDGKIFYAYHRAGNVNKDIPEFIIATTIEDCVERGGV